MSYFARISVLGHVRNPAEAVCPSRATRSLLLKQVHEIDETH